MMTEKKQNFFDCGLQELQRILMDAGIEKYRVLQVLNWFYLKDITDPSKMTNLPQKVKDILAHNFSFDAANLKKILESSDGTKKLVFSEPDGISFESILIPDEKKLTLCMSTQAGCALKCAFCYTGLGGLKRNLKIREIVGQYLHARRIAVMPITNIVFMGMGEPFDNSSNLKTALEILTNPDMLCFSARKITISTAGFIDEMHNFHEWEIKANLAVSLNSADDDVRSKLMPINKKYTLEQLLQTCRSLKLPTRQRITFEYVMLSGINDRDEDVRLLAKKLKGIKCKINLIVFNQFPDSKFKPPTQERVMEFGLSLRDAGFVVTIRKSKGEDIMAACGQLG
ncbi:MAG: 23S rRNA (adenine(2503)-C(2))-methyltransferase RlmN [Candidatus Schekmanbacteria bacterium]|nr:23S rRNA (adenine(2503)-C(2))-methyltransferase RlmN [Candidatus Schekmanbacteria bacterium]